MVLRAKTMIWALLGLSIFSIIVIVAVATRHWTSGSIGIIYVDGVIGESRSGGFLASPQETFMDQLRAAQQDNIQALVLRINSPGGSSASSQELYNTVQRISESGIPVVVSMADVAASGGYYLAAASDYIYANGSTITGSIGVIMEFENYQELYAKLGINTEIIKAGEFKDAGHQQRGLTPNEVELFQSVIDDAWDQFVADVAIGRNLPREEVVAVADGRILTGRQAQQIGLVDEIGGLEEALQKAKELAGITGSASIRTYEQQIPWYGRILAELRYILSTMQQPTVTLRY